MNASELRIAITQLRDTHLLRKSPDSYVEGFISAVMNVFPGSEVDAILQQKFFIPDESRYTDDAFFQSACELSVANHLKLKGVKGFETEKSVNPANGTNVDCYYEVGATKVALEVKCPVEATELSEGVFVLKTAGRVPNFREQYEDLRQKMESANPAAKLILGKNKDLTHKDFLLSAQGKFDPASGVDHLNILFIGCGDYFNINEWYMHLYGTNGLFTAESFLAAHEFKNVDVVMLSNLKYCHEHAREFHDWTLKDVFLLPRINPHGRPSCTSESRDAGLTPFNHHMKEFNAYNVPCEDSRVPDYVLENLKVNHYVAEHLELHQRNRYFPVRLQKESSESG